MGRDAPLWRFSKRSGLPSEEKKKKPGGLRRECRDPLGPKRKGSHGDTRGGSHAKKVHKVGGIYRPPLKK